MKVLLLAGEESGVMYAERIRGEILRTRPQAEIRGYADYGFAVADLAVMGIGQVLKKLFYFLRVKRTMERAIDDWKPDVVCTIDYPGMNIKLAAYAKAKGIRAVHVVCPQVWAWKQGRIPKIEASLDRLCCFFPFEPALFRPGFAAFVGHPLVEEMSAEEKREGRSKKDEGRTLALLPGSRMGEIDKHMPVLLEVVRGLREQLPDLKVVIPAASDRAYARISSLIPRPASQVPCPITLLHGGARDVLRQADAAVVASGTATLEAALAGCPTVLVYRVGWFFAFLARIVIRGVKHIGLANIVAEKAGVPCPMPELLQEAFTAPNVLSRLKPWLTDPAANRAARQALADTMARLKSEEGAVPRIVQTLFNRSAFSCNLYLENSL